MLSASMELMEREISIQAPWGKIAVLTWGEASNKPVLMFHGKIDSAAIFRPLVRMLPKDFYYIGVDFPGNGRSEHLPKGVPLSVLDFVPTVKTVADHFGLQRFTYVGHSMGAHVGKYFHIAYPSYIESLVELDPVPAYMSHNVDTLDEWYHFFYGGYFKPENYKKYNAPTETAPTYTREKALQLMQRNRGLSAEAAAIAIERTLEPAGDGLYRFTFDQRMKIVMRPPFSSKYLEDLYTKMQMPILCIMAEESVNNGWFDSVPFIRDESKYKKGNYKVLTVAGNHDVHLNSPERIAEVVSKFLLKNAGQRSKL